MDKEPSSFPARLHPILARNGTDAVVFRRGPSKAVCAVHWDLRKDEFTPGQWLKGRIYERRADLSPDGKYMIYFAMNGKWDSETGGSWTAISRTPYLKALELHGKGDCWQGGGLFTGARKYWLNGGGCHKTITKSAELSRDQAYRPTEQYGDECPGVYYLRLQRDGWTLTRREGPNLDRTAIFEKALPKGWTLRKTAHEQVGQPEGKGCYWDEHELENAESGERMDKLDWEWAELEGESLVYATGGKLFRTRVDTASRVGEPVLLRDFNDMRFATTTAPY